MTARAATKRAPGRAPQPDVAPDIAYVVDPRFGGGTSAAVAEELRTLVAIGHHPRLHAIESRLFRGRALAPALAEACDALGIACDWDIPQIGADLVVLHNPSFLRFDETFAPMILCRQLIVVTHENFARPGGLPGFDATKCIRLIGARALALRKSLAPISPWNRAGVTSWADLAPDAEGWDILPDDWFNICGTSRVAPTARPRDRRGRLSRPGPEKFPAPEVLDRLFPAHAEANVILGADSFLTAGQVRPHWQALRFNEISPAEFFAQIDFMVYFTSPAWSESFGRVLAEAIMAGKVVIADHRAAANFPGAVISARPEEVDGIIAAHIADPALYAAQVVRAQAALVRFSPTAFGSFFQTVLDALPGERT